MFIQLVIVMLYGNQEINSRVASSLPIYFWALGAMVVEGNGDPKFKGAMTIPARIAVFHNVLFLLLNLLGFSSEWAFY